MPKRTALAAMTQVLSFWKPIHHNCLEQPPGKLCDPCIKGCFLCVSVLLKTSHLLWLKRTQNCSRSQLW